MMNAIILSVIMISVIMMNAIILSVIIFSAIMPSVVILIAIMLSVVAPFRANPGVTGIHNGTAYYGSPGFYARKII